MENLKELNDILGSLLNRTFIAKVLIKQIPQKPEYRQYLNTLLEDNHQDSQMIIDDYCVVYSENDKEEAEIPYVGMDSDANAD